MNELFKIIVRNKLTPNGLYILNSMIEKCKCSKFMFRRRISKT